MTTTPASDVARLPLTARRATSTFGMSVLGLLSANLLPFMVVALQDALGVGVAEAGTIMTGSLLATALTCIAVTRLAEGTRRVAVARVGLVVAAVGFGVAASSLGTVMTVGGVIVGGAGAGGALAASGAALAALRNPNRMSAANGLVNRFLVTVVLAVVPLVGVTLSSVYGLVAGLAVALLLMSAWLPAAPVVDERPVAREVVADESIPRRRVTVAGVALLVMYALWAISEDSLWAVAGTMGAEHAGLGDAALGVVLSVSSAGGFVAALALIVLGDRLGRAVPLGVLLVVGGALKVGTSVTTDPTVFGILLVAWNSVYLAAFLLFIAAAAALDANGRFSGPSVGVYLVGSSFAPMAGGWLAQTFGYGTFGWVLGVASWLLVLPVVLVARLSTRVEKPEMARRQAATIAEEARR